ncbi:MAG: hydrogenase formation protein HypD [Deltaproteobacteria bacterium]|nr:MAG: hydrogenase formation protein HypD [Deltaproteobacteria bacterium]
MKYVDEFRDPAAVRALAEELRQATTRPWRIMEVCGGQTHAFVRFGIDRLLPDGVELIHGPGCPVCVTSVEVIDRALALAARPDVVFCTFGDMLRVPGSTTDLLQVKAAGGDVRTVYSPLDAVKLAQQLPDKQVVFFAVGFETTAPGAAMAVHHAAQAGIDNFSVLVAHVLVPPALEAIAGAEDTAVNGFLAAGHVCTVMGTEAYRPLAEHYSMPIVVTGFEPTDLLRGLLACVRQLEEGRAEVENAYERAVRDEGNPAARTMVERVFEPVEQQWRGIGALPASGLGLREAYHRFDAARRFDLPPGEGREDPECRAGEVLRGVCKPEDCAAFGNRCTPDHPLGAPMVSSEGACAAYYRYRRTA